MSQILSLKSCPRCKGDMQSNRDMYGSYKECLQCGNMMDDPTPVVDRSVLAAKKRAVRSGN